MSSEPDELTVHGSAVAWAGRAALILGASGSGKSGLALRLIAGGAALVADDRVVLRRVGQALLARAPASLEGLIEARGVGLLRLEAAPEAVVAVAVDLDRPAMARMPQRDTIAFLGVPIELILGREVPNLDVTLTLYMQNRRAAPE